MQTGIMITRRLFVTVYSLALATCGAATTLAVPPEPHFTSITATEQWRRGSDQVLVGDFAGAVETLEKLRELEPGHTEVATAIEWLRDAKALTESRERLRQRNYEYYVAEALKAAQEARESPGDQEETKENTKTDEDKPEGDEKATQDEGGYKWSRALDHARMAMLNAKDEEAFRNEPWLEEIVSNVLVEIEGHKRKNEWRDALVLYDILKHIYPKNTEYEEGYDFCRRRARLDVVYGPKSNWEVDLRDVGKEAIREIASRIEHDYVEPADFRVMCTSGLENLIILAEADSLTQAFPALGDADLVNHFVVRIKGLIKNQVQGRAKFRRRDVDLVFRKVMEINRDSLRLPESVLVDEFVAGMLEPLDEFTAVIWPAEVDEFNKHTRGEFVGVGIQITQADGQPVRVESPLEDSPAYRAGIKPGDLIEEVNGKSTTEMTIMQTVRAITGEPGTEVTLTIRDALTKELRPVTLVRQRIKIQTVRGHQRDATKPTGWDYMIDPQNGIAYVRVSGFMEETVDDLEAALNQMRAEGCRGLILDLRFNPGGLLTSAVGMCELFLGEDDWIVKTKGRSTQQYMEIRSRARKNFGNLPLIVLVNEYSASASEIVAGALAGEKEACVIGTRTFGKGSVQNLIPIADNQAYLKLTTAHYYIHDEDVPGEDSWYCLHRRSDSENWGVEPHITVPVIPQELSKILRLRRERDVLKGRGQDEIPPEVLERRPTSQPAPEFQKDEHPDTDPQIMTALNVMRIKLLSNQPWALAPRHNRVLSKAEIKVKPLAHH